MYLKSSTISSKLSIKYLVSSNVFSFNVKNVDSGTIANILNDKFNICVRSGNHCAKMIDNVFNISNTVRVSLSFYNTKEEIDKLKDSFSY
mgnify:CR=1 FL=1